MLKSKQPVAMDDLLALKVGSIWIAFKQQSFAFWMVCGYLFVEYFRPQSIITGIDILPWAQVFLILSLFGMIAEKRRQWARSFASFWMIVFFLLIVMSAVFAYDPDIAWLHLQDYYTWLIIYFVIINTVNNEKRLFIFLSIFFLASAKLAFFGARIMIARGFSFSSWGISGPPGYFQNSGELAIQMLVFFALSYFLFVAMRSNLKGWRYYFMLFCPMAAAITILGASSRGAQLAFCIQVLIIFSSKLSLPRLFLATFLCFMVYQLIPDAQFQRFSEMGADDTSIQRMLYWTNGWEIIKRHPLLGVGHFNFPAYYNDHFPQDLIGMRISKGAELPHNIFVQAGADLGFLGLGIYLMLIYSFFRENFASQRRLVLLGGQRCWLYYLSRGLNVGVIGFVLAGQFVSVLYYPFFWISLALAVSLRSVIELRKVVD